MPAIVNFDRLKMEAYGTCEGGEKPDPPIDNFPLLAWAPNHSVFGDDVHTEDGKASVWQILDTWESCGTTESIPERFGTTLAHVFQAVLYASRVRR